MNLPDPEQPLRQRFNHETARLQWHELLPHFAAGSVFVVDVSLDLIDVAVKISQHDTVAVSDWMARGLIARVDDGQAGAWVASDPAFWTVIVKPWVLVQPDQRRRAPPRHDA